MKTGIELIAEERREQVEKHGRDIEFDVKNNKLQQLRKAAAILMSDKTVTKKMAKIPDDWNPEIWVHIVIQPYEKQLIIAGALIAAELDRIIYNENERETEDKFKKYRDVHLAELRPVTVNDIELYLASRTEKLPASFEWNISISKLDLDNGSPRIGDMIARNPKNHSDQWLISEKYFKDNFEQTEQ